MAIRHVMVHLDQGQRTAHRLQFAVALAQRHGARLVGVFGQLAHAQQVGVVASWPPLHYVEAGAQSRALFEQATAGLAGAEWRDINRGSDGEVVRLVTQTARHFDLVVMGQYDERDRAYEPADLVHEVVQNSGRPVLVMPYIWQSGDIGKSPLIAWNDTREAARALNDALPLIEGCGQAWLLSMATRRSDAEAASDEVGRHLACHGIAARAEAFVFSEDESVGAADMLLNRASDRGADLLVMGAEAIQSGRDRVYPRQILRHMTVPVLMSA